MRRALLLSLPLMLSSMNAHAAPIRPGAPAQIEAQTTKNWGELEALYKDLHSHPEIGFTETRTAGILSEKLRKLGFEVAASTGKQAAHATLEKLGASEIVDRNTLCEENKRPMLKEDWAAAVDVVGGDTLSNIIKSLRYGGSVAVCGLVQSPSFSTTVLPFILRGVNLLGVDSVQLPIETKRRLWVKLGAQWKLDHLEDICTDIGFGELDASLAQVLKGGANGRFVLDLNS